MSDALVADGALLILVWPPHRAAALSTWYRQHATRLLRFFGPLEVVATETTIANTYAWSFRLEQSNGLSAS